MPEFKKQHYLPVVYLKQFSVDGCSATRKSSIWRLDREGSKPVSVESQCAPKHFYSQHNPKGAEKTFHEIEGTYGEIAWKIWRQEQSSRRDFFALILMMLDLHCRNAAYENRTGKDNLFAYNVRMQCMRELMGDGNTPLSNDQFFNRWRVRLFENEDQSGLVTSDNPALFFTLDETNQLHLVVLPVTPSCCAIAFDRRFVGTSGNSFTAQDGALLNFHQMRHCNDCLFSAVDLTTEQKHFVQREWKKRAPDVGYVDETVWTPNLIRFPSDGTLSVLFSLKQRQQGQRGRFQG